MPTQILLLIAGFVLLIKGADWLVGGSSSIAKRFGISDLVIGLTVVAFGTSTPELVVNVFASLQGNTEIAIGNIVGSNIANILLILGAASLLAPLTVQRSTVLKELPFSLLAVVTLLVMANDALIDGYASSEISRGDGLVFIGFFIIFLYYTFGIRNGSGEANEDEDLPTHTVWMSLLLLLGGLIGLVGGGKLAVDAAVSLATSLGVSQSLVGLTVVAVGTSLPEMAASMVAAYRGKADIAVGNIVGSNIFNVFWILGISAIIKPLTFTPAMNADLIVVVLATVLLFFIVHTGHLHHRVLLWWRQGQGYNIRRFEGAVLLGSYIAYIAYISWRG